MSKYYDVVHATNDDTFAIYSTANDRSPLYCRAALLLFRGFYRSMSTVCVCLLYFCLQPFARVWYHRYRRNRYLPGTRYLCLWEFSKRSKSSSCSMLHAPSLHFAPKATSIQSAQHHPPSHSKTTAVIGKRLWSQPITNSFSRRAATKVSTFKELTGRSSILSSRARQLCSFQTVGLVHALLYCWTKWWN